MSSSASDSNAKEGQSLLGHNHTVSLARKRQRLPKCCVKCCCGSLATSTVLCAVIAVALAASYGAINNELQDYIASKTALVKGSATMKEWSSPSTLSLFNVYMLNLTNKDAFSNGAKPIFKEIGPFVYRENTTRHDLVWSHDEMILKYNVSTTYIFDSVRSKGLDPLKINITTINAPLMGILIQFEKLQAMAKKTKSKVMQEILNDVIEGLDEALRNEFKENLFITKSVDEIVFGYTDPFLQFIADLDLPIEGMPKDGKFIINERSSSSPPNKPSMIYTGKNNPAYTDRFLMWRGLGGISGWGSPYCGMLNGTQSVIFHPGVARSDILSVFVHELYRSIDFSYDKDVETFGVKVYRYILADYVMNSSKSDPGFNMDGPDGVFNLTAVYPMNLPVFMTKPHFLDCPVYGDYVQGLRPNRSVHDTHLHVEPLTGAILGAAKRLQVNIEMKQNSNIKELASLQNATYFPLLWIEEGGQMNSTQADFFKKMVYTPVNLVHGFAIGLAAAAGFAALLSCLLLLVLLAASFCGKKNFRQENKFSYDTCQ